MDERNRSELGHGERRKIARDAQDETAKRRRQQAKRKEELEKTLDRGLEDTFPGSDPVAITQPPHSRRDKS
jgi:hypothetical protein